MTPRYQNRLVLQVILLDDQLRRDVEDYLRAGGLTVMRGRQMPLHVATGFVAAAVEITPREREALATLLDHDKTTQMAEALGISPRTVESHLQDLMRRLGVRSRHRLIVQAAVLGLIGLVPGE